MLLGIGNAMANWQYVRLNSCPIDSRTPSVEQIEAQIAQLRLNPNGIEAIEALFAQLRGFAQRCAPDAAVFLHPQLAQLKHDQRGKWCR
jgi:hypothetical protein